MIDVGAHIGGSMARFARAGWRVLAFEPDAENRSRLTDMFGSFPNVTIDPRGVSDSCRQGVTLFRSEQSTGISALSPFHPSHVAGEKVDVTTLQKIYDEYALQEISFLKIDTEGFDLPVLQGFPWNRTMPQLILCEFEDSKTLPIGYDFQDLTHYLDEKGYRMVVSEWFPVKRYGVRHKWRRFIRFPCELEDVRAWGNILATQDDRLFHSLLRECGLAASR